MAKQYLAHSPTESHPEGQPLYEHLTEVASLAGRFAGKFGAREEGFYAGMLHDIGKYAKDFQRRLAGSHERVDHATAGAIEAWHQKAASAAFAIAGHHGGLPDYGSRFDGQSFCGRMSKEYRDYLPDYSAFREEVVLPPVSVGLPAQEDFFFHTKMLFSCLVDADWSDTSRYFREEPEKERSYATLGELNARLDACFAEFSEEGKEINILRNRIRQGVLAHTDDPSGLFSLTVPTGGGKTLVSMAFALKHALRHGLERIVYVIPYCSILEQTAAVFSGCFGAENLCLHYSTAEFKASEKEGEKADPNAFVSERWDAPIVLTTSVQFFESLYANGPSRCRKLHHLCKSVIIFDEAQMLPLPYLSPCVFAICQLVKNFGSSALLCTATQPSLGPLIEKYLPGQGVTELCPDREEMAERFRRVTYRMKGAISDEALLEKLSEERQVLAVVNNRRQAQTLYEGLAKEGSFCLTTYLTPHDRKAVLAEIKRRLEVGEVCRVVSTSLIEAGVDLDFPTVWRALAGLDSIVQAGGRCNREGKRTAADSIVHIFQSEARAPRSLGQNISAAERTMRKYPEDPAGSSAMTEYFDFLIQVLKGEEGQDRKAIMDEIEKLAYETIARAFHLIEEDSGLLYIREPGGEDVIDALESGVYTRDLLRKAALFSVSLPRKKLDLLVAVGKAKPLFENGALLLDLSCYDSRLGFQADEEDKAIFI